MADVRIELQNLDLAVNIFAKKKADVYDDSNKSVVVGYTQNYAIYVHENLEAHHDVGEAKFLEKPYKNLARELAKVIATSMATGKRLIDALLLAGLRLQRESQKLVPVDTGALKNSAFTAIEHEQGPGVLASGKTSIPKVSPIIRQV
jgi:hypothetical protein